jgi:iron complex outermembrane receptor protein
MFFEHQFKYGKLDFTPGIFVSHYSDFGWNAFPGIDIGFLARPDLRFYTNLGKSYRVPTFYDMYYESPVEKGNPDLKPEKALTFEIGARYLKNPLSIELNWFYQDAHDLIDWVGIPTTDSTYLWKAANISNIKRNGIEIATQLNMERLVDHKLIIKNVYLSYNFINSDLSSSVELSRYILENLRYQFIFGFNSRIIAGIFLDFKTRMNKREGESGYWVFDSRLYWEKGKGPHVYIEATNLTNTQYYEGMTPMPGRWFRAGIMYQLGF